jgi:endonuclease/exonuclease/phosphatase family metal-dependent hydrolase
VSRIKVATYNIHRGIGNDGRFRPERIRAVLAEINADVFALQEVESSRSGFDMLYYLSEATGLAPLAGTTLTRETGDYGNALLTRMPIIEARRIDLSVAGREARGALDVDVVWHGHRLRIVTTHLGLRPRERRTQIRRLLASFRDREADATILMGDLNEWLLWGRPLRWLHAHFEATPAPATFATRMPVFALDRLWVKPRRLLRELAVHASPLARIASDHLPLYGVIDLPVAAENSSQGDSA